MAAPTDLGKMQKTHEGEHHGDFGAPIPITRAAYTFVLCAAVNSVNLGYDIGLSTSAGKLIQADFNLSITQREVFVASLNFWAIFGAMFAHFATDRYGRRRTFILAAIGFIIGCIIIAVSPDYGFLMVGRFLLGIGVGTGLAIDPLYIAEVTPAKHRGELVTWSEIALNVGIVLGFSMSLFLSPIADNVEWRIMFLLGCILPSVMIYLAMYVMPESPRWLVANGRDDEARGVLKDIYPPDFNVEPVIDDIKEALAREAAAEEGVGWQVVLRPTPAIRRMLMVGVGVSIAQQAVGIDAIQYYLLDVIEQTGIDNQNKETLVLIFLGLIKLVFIVVGGKLFDVRGRRPLFFVSLTGMSAALFVVSIAFYINSNVADVTPGFVIFGIAIYLAFFSIGMGPGAWLIASETFATCIRAKAMSIATVANRVTATIMASTFLTLSKAIGWASLFLMFALIALLALAYIYHYMPETNGRSLEDMSIYFAEITGDKSILEAEARIRGQLELGSRSSQPNGNNSNRAEVL